MVDMYGFFKNKDKVMLACANYIGDRNLATSNFTINNVTNIGSGLCKIVYEDSEGIKTVNATIKIIEDYSNLS